MMGMLSGDPTLVYIGGEAVKEIDEDAIPDDGEWYEDDEDDEGYIRYPLNYQETGRWLAPLQCSTCGVLVRICPGDVVFGASVDCPMCGARWDVLEFSDYPLLGGRVATGWDPAKAVQQHAWRRSALFGLPPLISSTAHA